MTPRHIEERRIALEAYLQEIIKTEMALETPYVTEFLRIPHSQVDVWTNYRKFKFSRIHFKVRGSSGKANSVDLAYRTGLSFQ